MYAEICSEKLLPLLVKYFLGGYPMQKSLAELKKKIKLQFFEDILKRKTV